MTNYKISFWACVALVVSSMVGTGVYTSLGFQLESAPSPFSVIALWLLGGILALCGAFSYAELACMFPRSGGEYNLLSRVFHPALGFAAGVTSATVGFAAPVALAAMAFGKYSFAFLPGVSQEKRAVIALCLISLAHLGTLRLGSRVQRVIALVSLLLIVAFILANFMYAHPQPLSFFPGRGDGAYILSAPFAVSLMYVMYAYSGWNAPIYVGDEIANLRKGLSTALFMGTLIVLCLYVGLNAAFLYSTPAALMRGQLDVANVAGAFVFGSLGNKLASSLICISLLGCMSSMMWIGPRIIKTMGEDIGVLRFFEKTNISGIPVRAILAQLGLALLMLYTATFEAVLLFAQSAMLLSSLCCVVGVVVLRIKSPEIERPYRCPFCPLTPLFFAAVTVAMLVYAGIARPFAAGLGVAAFLFSIMLYFLCAGKVSKKAQ